MDHFLEEVVIKKHRVMDEIMYYLSWAILVFSGFTALMELSAFLSLLSGGNGVSWPDLILGLVSAGIAVGVFLTHDRLRTEYEYTFTNGVLDFAMVFNNKKRKNLGSLKVKNIESFGAVDTDAFRRIINTPGVKQERWFLNREAHLYFFYFQKDENKKIIILEPSEEMVSLIRHYIPFTALVK